MDALAICRFLEFAPTMILFGAFFFVAVFAPAALKPALAPALGGLAKPLALLAVAAALAWLVAVTKEMTDGAADFGAVRDVLLSTEFGAVWQARFVLLAWLVVAVWRPDQRFALPAVAAGLALVSLALVGHAAMQTGWVGAAHRVNHALHLTLTAGWLGGLVPFLLCLARATRRGEALTAMRRFSRVGHFAVPGVLVTGALDIAMTTGKWPWPPDTPYREGLAAKVCVFAAMTALALLNRYVFAPAAARRADARHALAAGAVIEIALALTAVALVSGFATLDPA